MRIKKRDFFAAFCIAISIFFLLSGIFGLFFPKNALGTYIFALFTYIGGFMIPAALYIVVREIKIPVGVKKKDFAPNSVKFIIISSIFSFLLYVIVKMGLLGLGEINLHKVYFAKMTVPLNSLYEIVLSIIIFALIPAICEEFIFRNILFEEYKGLGLFPFCVISALMSSFICFDFELFLALVIVNAGFAILRIYFKSFYISAAAHFIFNLLVIFIEPYIWSFLSRSERKSWFWIVLLAVFFLILYFMITIFQRLVAEQKFDKSIKFNKESLSPYILTPSFLLLASVFVILTAISGILY